MATKSWFRMSITRIPQPIYLFKVPFILIYMILIEGKRYKNKFFFGVKKSQAFPAAHQGRNSVKNVVRELFLYIFLSRIYLNWISPFIGTWGRNRRQLRNHRPLQSSISDPVPILQPPTASVSEYARRIEILANDLANGSAGEGSKPKEPPETPPRGSSRSPGSSSGMKDYLFNIRECFWCILGRHSPTQCDLMLEKFFESFLNCARPGITL